MDQGPGTQAASGALRYGSGRARSLKGEGCIHVKRCRENRGNTPRCLWRAGCMGTQHTGRIPGRIGAGCRLCRTSGCMAVSGHPARTGRRWTELRLLRLLILAGGFLMGLCFILRLPYNFSWHDLASYSADFSGEAKPDGHLGYMPGLWKRHIALCGPSRGGI